MSDPSVSTLERIDRACDHFEDAWLAGRRPRVEDHLRDAPERERPALRRELLRVASAYFRADQRRRWEGGERVPVTEYLREEPALGEEPEHVLALVGHEAALRRERGEAPRAEDYLALLPGHEAPLRRLLNAPREAATPTAGGPGAPGPPPAAERPARPPALDRYLPGGFIGRGGMGEVFWAYDPQLGRDLAVKVLRAEHRGDPTLARRFLEEARIAGRLQHPGVAPVHDLGVSADGRPYFTMKLVQGRTLADLLRERANPADDLPRFLAVFGQVCQAVAYAHSEGVIHRDLKPSNVMVGAFGEVQVMDWGLAKVLGPAPAEGRDEGGREEAPAAAAGETVDLGGTQQGQVLGTAAYMPPEQARGEVEHVDRRSDVFGLGAILCEVLTGRAPFDGEGTGSALDRARACDHAAALARLAGCGADAELVRLCKDCLAAAPDARPGDAAEVARAVAAYQAGVGERLRAAELGQAAAQARAEGARAAAAAERRARRRTRALAAALLLLVGVGGGGAWWLQQRQQKVDAAAGGALTEARGLFEEAKRAPLADGGKCREALQAAQRAEQFARNGRASAALQEQAAALVAEVGREAEAAGRDRRLLARLPDVRGPRPGPRFRADDNGPPVALTDANSDEQFAAAFREWGLDVDATPAAEAAARLRGRPAVVTEVVAALDEWAQERRAQGRPPAEWRRLADLAAAVEGPDSKRGELRAILGRGNLPAERALGALSRLLLPYTALTDEVPGADRNRLRRLAEGMDAAAEPVLGLLLLTRALSAAGDEARAERLLRAAVRARPQEALLHYTLGKFLEGQRPPRWREAVECYAAARALRPQLGVALAEALARGGQPGEGLALLDQIAAERGDHLWLHFSRGFILLRQHRGAEAEAEFREALRLRPDFPEAYSNLGNALQAQGRYPEADAAYRDALRLKPAFWEARYNLPYSLAAQGKHREAEDEARAALRLWPDAPEAHFGLGNALRGQRRYPEAEGAYRAALRLRADYPEALTNLGIALAGQGKYREAEAEYREALRRQPDLPPAWNSLSSALNEQRRYREAEAAGREALRLRPDYFEALLNLGYALGGQGEHREREAAFRAALRLRPDNAEAHGDLSNALLAQGKAREAEAEGRTAVGLKPGLAVLHYNLANALKAQGKAREAVAEYQEALRLRPDFPEARVNLGLALYDQGRYREAEAAWRAALSLKGDDPHVHYDLGLALYNQGKFAEAEGEYRAALRLAPDYPEAHCNLGLALQSQGRFAEALPLLRRGHELGSKFPAWGYPSEWWVRRCERLLALDRKLPAALGDGAAPKGAGECLELAELCRLPCKRLYAASARFYAAAFAAGPQLAADPRTGHRYRAACAAALAAAGKGEDAGRLAEEQRQRLRRQALDWLRADLAAWTKTGPTPQARQLTAQALQHWQKAPDLAGLRDKAALDQLPAAERDAWQRLWADVDTLLKGAQET